MTNYLPNELILKNFADVLINFALNSGDGIKKGEVVNLILNENAKPFLNFLQRAIWEAGGNVLLTYLPAEFTRDRDTSNFFYDIASEDQIRFFPREFLQAKIDLIDHVVLILSPSVLDYYDKSNKKNMKSRNLVWKEYMDMRNQKEYAGKLTWTLTNFPTQALANEAGITLEQYWEQVIRACFLDDENPIQKNKESVNLVQETAKNLNMLGISNLYITGEGIDLKIFLNKDNIFVGGTGRNVPSFEVFTSPDARKTEGYIKFNQPLYRNGNIIEGIELTFEKGSVTKFNATKNYDALKAMLDTDPNSRRVGEFSLTDKRISKINRIMANTLYDENFGGDFGNTHIALGQSYKDAIKDFSRFIDNELVDMGFNNSAIHTDIISTSPRTVWAETFDGKRVKIYENGIFLI